MSKRMSGITARETVLQYGADILESDGMQREKRFRQHGNVSVYTHSVGVACLCVLLAENLHVKKVDQRALVRGALLHDYFLYDWHTPEHHEALHGFTHARRALNNAARDFSLGCVERDMIVKHMFPLNITPPKYRESVLICIADKICATCEALSIPCFQGELDGVASCRKRVKRSA